MRVFLPLILAAGLAAPALLPAGVYLPRTLRAARLADRPEAQGDLAAHWLPVAAPNAYGNSRFLHYWGLSNTNEDASGFVGTVALLAALLTLVPGRRLPQERLFLGVALLCLALLSPWGPGSRRLLLPLALSLAYLAACTFERVRTGEIRRWTVVAAALVLGGLIAWGYLAHADPSDPASLAPLRMGWLRWQGRFLILGTLLLFFGTGRKWTAPVSAGLAALIAAELLLLHLPANPPMPKSLLMPVNGPIRFLQDHLKDGGGDGRMAALGRDFPPNLPNLYGLADLRVYNPMAPAAYVHELEPIIAGWWGELPELGHPESPLYRELGVRYILTAPGAALPPPLHPVFQDEDGWVWEVPGVAVHPERAPVYRPSSFFLGMLIAALSLAAMTALVVPEPCSPSSGDVN